MQGLTVTGAIGEGILATGSLENHSISDVVIQHNRVVGNDTGGSDVDLPAVPCSSREHRAGDCGEGIHLMGVADSIVQHNFDSGNSGGMLLTDEFGPTHGNLIDHNTVTENQSDCGITVPGHNPMAIDASGNLHPLVAGVYDNVISHNTVTNNGLLGEGAGVLFANAAPGTASYDNLVVHNYIAGNGLSGVTMHAHTIDPKSQNQFEDLNGNTIVHNTIGQNNLDGDGLDGTVSDSDTTGILVFSGSVAVQVNIAQNRISNNVERRLARRRRQRHREPEQERVQERHEPGLHEPVTGSRSAPRESRAPRRRPLAAAVRARGRRGRGRRLTAETSDAPAVRRSPARGCFAAVVACWRSTGGQGGTRLAGRQQIDQTPNHWGSAAAGTSFRDRALGATPNPLEHIDHIFQHTSGAAGSGLSGWRPDQRGRRGTAVPHRCRPFRPRP